MKKLNILLGILIGFTIIACSSDDDSPSGNEETIRLYKKSEVYSTNNLVFDKTINYNSENKIQSVITNDYGYKTETITVNYSGNTISSITEIDNFVNPNNTDQNVTYDMTVENNKITLTSGDLQLKYIILTAM